MSLTLSQGSEIVSGMVHESTKRPSLSNGLTRTPSVCSSCAHSPKGQEKKKNKEHMGATKRDKRSHEPVGAALSNQPTHAPSGTFANMVHWRLSAKSCGFFHRAAQKRAWTVRSVGGHVAKRAASCTMCQPPSRQRFPTATTGRQKRDINAVPRPKKRERFSDGKRDATTRRMQRTTSC